MLFQSDRLCNPALHLNRRRLLGAGGGVLLSSMAQRLTVAQEKAKDSGKPPKSVILLWMEGGPSQLETFDPHAGTMIGGDAQAIETSIKDVQIADVMMRTAEELKLCTLVRSMVGREGDHERAVYNIKTGYRPDPTLVHPSIGAVLCHADASGADIPRHISITPGGSPARGGFLGAKLDAFKIGDPKNKVSNVHPSVPEPRYQQRLKDLRDVIEPQFRRGRMANLEENRTLHQESTLAARRMMSSDQLAAFEVTEEPKSELEAFGDHQFGRGCLAAARLIEVGVRCVEVTLGGWDSHVNNHSLQTSAAEKLDAGLASLLKRLEERGLLETTLVVCGGEFGRTPRINPAGGRDHWPHGFSMLMAGAGFRRGHVHGATSKELVKEEPASKVADPVKVADLHSTIYQTLGLDPMLEYQTPIGRPMARSEGRVIDSLLT